MLRVVKYLILVGAVGVVQATWQLKDLKAMSPRTNFKNCGFSSPASLCDPDLILTNTGRQNAEKILASSEVGEVAMVFVKYMHYSSVEGKESAAKRFAKGLHDAWGVGDASRNDGVMIFFSIGDRQMYISTGRGAKTLLPDGDLQYVISSLRPDLKERRYDKAAAKAAEMIVKGLKEGGICSPFCWVSGLIDTVLGLLFWGAILILPATWSWYSSRKRRNEYKEFKRKLKEIEKLKSAKLSKKFEPTTCPICLEPFEGDEEEKKTEDSTSDEQEKEPTMILPCGHKFHEECIDGWLKDNRVCPVCRQSVDDDDKKPKPGEDTSTRGHQGSSTYTSSSYYSSSPSIIDLEIMYRLTRLRSMHPTFINQQAVNDWGSPTYQGSFDHQDRTYCPDPFPSGSSSGSSGGYSSSGFGGGSSFGGGGGGGGW